MYKRQIEGCHTLDYENWDEVAMAMDKARRLHRCGITSPWNFDIYEETQKIIRMLDERSRTFSSREPPRTAVASRLFVRYPKANPTPQSGVRLSAFALKSATRYWELSRDRPRGMAMEKSMS